MPDCDKDAMEYLNTLVDHMYLTRDITGETVYYGGGGAGGQRDYSPAETPAAVAGLGGGKANWGGGGSGGYRYTRNAEAGGRGIVIIRYKKPEKAFMLLVR